MGSQEPADDGRAVVVSSDTHIGPTLAQLRPYCSARDLEAFDDYADEHRAYMAALVEMAPSMFTEVDGELVRYGETRKTKGHNDIDERLRDLDFDGVAAEVIFHGSQNDEPIPFTNLGDPRNTLVFKNNAPSDPASAAAGRHIYNAWLADFCATEPERHVGLAQIPIWDVDASVRELEWAREAGLRGVNFPAPQSWLAEYDKAVWEPLWAAADALEMPLVTHFGIGSSADYSGPSGRAVNTYESGNVFGKRAVPWMIFGGVFERHPRLKLVITEVPGRWWTAWMAELDSIHRAAHPARPHPVEGLYEICPRLPSEYAREHLFVGASFMSHAEAEAAWEEGYATNYLWGSDYPHREGTFRYPDRWDETPLNHVALRFAFAGIPREPTRLMVGANAVDVYGLDDDALGRVADRINAPTFAELSEPIEPPEDVTSLAFRHSYWD
jgi:predicted TIM-barrel fold metal-dependent hydrolase